MTQKQEILSAILSDNLDKARSLVGRASANYRLIADLLRKTEHKPPPLNRLRSDYPKFIYVPTSLTCDLGCKMCGSGFHDRTSLREDYKYFHPSELDALSPWMETAEFIHLVGVGETLESPYIPEFLDRIKDKVSILTTSGVPLTREKAILFIQSGLNYLNFSFDGKTSIGHGDGNDRYISKFWERAALVQKVKEEFHSALPILDLSITINSENIDQLDDIFATAHANGFKIIHLTYMLPRDHVLFKKSIFPTYEASKNNLDDTLAKWTGKGMDIFPCQQEGKMPDSLGPCYFIDNYLTFNFRETFQSPRICCGPLDLPIGLSNLSKSDFWNSFPMRYLRYLRGYVQPGEQLIACRDCFIINPKQCAETLSSDYKNLWKDNEAYPLYHVASQAKQNGGGDGAESLFTELLRLRVSPSLKGKICFQLGEIHIKKQQYPQALSFMKLAVQHCYDHQMAFAYLYLLMALIENSDALPQKEMNTLPHPWEYFFQTSNRLATRHAVP